MVECNFCDLGDFGSHLLLYGLGILLDKKREESKCIREHRGTTSRVSWWHLKFLKEEPNP